MEFRKAHIWAARFEVMKVFVLQIKKIKKIKICVKRASHSPVFLRSVIIALGWTQGAPHKLEKFNWFIPWDHKKQIRSTIPFLRAPAWVGKDAAPTRVTD